MKIPTLIPAVLVIVGLLALARWTTLETKSLENRVPGMDGTPDPAATDGQGGQSPEAVVAGQPIPGPGIPAEIPGSWPAFRGPHRDAICDDGTPLAHQWPPAGPPVMWQVELADGYAGAVISNGRVYVLDYVEAPVEENGTGEASGASPAADGGTEPPPGADTLRCLSLDDGREIWRNGYPVHITPNHGITRTVPALVEDYVITFGPRYHLACWDAATGENRWLIDMVRQFGTEERGWYNGQCPLVDQGRLIVAPGSPDCLMMALDYATGEIVWQTPNPRGWKMTHASIMPMEFAGRRMYVYCGTGGTVGVAADDGTLLWDETTWSENFATSPSPLPLPDGRIFLCSGYDITGAEILQLREQGQSILAETALTIPRKKYNSEQQTPVLYNGYLYGVKKLRGQLLCMDLEGNEVWNSGKLKFGHGPYMIADGMVLVLGDDGLLVIVEATHESFRLLGQSQIWDSGHEAWGPMAMVAGRLVARDMDRMVCLDLR